jgi:hypothetical protein
MPLDKKILNRLDADDNGQLRNLPDNVTAQVKQGVGGLILITQEISLTTDDFVRRLRERGYRKE